LDKQIHISFEFSPNAPALNLRGVVSDIQTKDTSSGDKESVITVMSPFKNYRKQVIHTTYFPDATPLTTPMGIIAEDYMGLAPDEYDFSNMVGTLNKFRIDGLTIPEALKLFAETENKELCWYQGELITKGLGPGIAYDKSRCSILEVENENDLKIINVLNVIGAESGRWLSLTVN